jgi:hypothetical protein
MRRRAANAARPGTHANCARDGVDTPLMGRLVQVPRLLLVALERGIVQALREEARDLLVESRRIRLLESRHLVALAREELAVPSLTILPLKLRLYGVRGNTGSPPLLPTRLLLALVLALVLVTALLVTSVTLLAEVML